MIGVTSKKITYYFALTLRRVNQILTRLTAILEKTPKDHPDYPYMEEAAAEARSITNRWQ